MRPMTEEDRLLMEFWEAKQREQEAVPVKPKKTYKPRMEKPKQVFKTTLQIRAEEQAAADRKAMREAVKLTAEDLEHAAIRELLTQLLENVAVSHPESIVSLMWDGDLPRSTKRRKSEMKDDYDSWKPRWSGTE